MGVTLALPPLGPATSAVGAALDQPLWVSDKLLPPAQALEAGPHTPLVLFTRELLSCGQRDAEVPLGAHSSLSLGPKEPWAPALPASAIYPSGNQGGHLTVWVKMLPLQASYW